jgi:hypothetical protein
LRDGYDFVSNPVLPLVTLLLYHLLDAALTAAAVVK